jgi:Asp-tRNA(Asn)/Glu-tRNA(Gln) amidotransferase A subunit family amidase
MSIHSHNKIWGTALNFYDKRRSCGGSSGGDAGLVASRCVPIAIGSDIGGSIRIPAHFTGVTAFKPSNRRITFKGGRSPRLSEFDILSGFLDASAGPLAHSVNDCTEFFKLQCCKNAHLKDPFKGSSVFD